MEDEPFEKKLEKFSVIKRCPRCGELSLTSKKGNLFCSNCGFEEKFSTIR